MKDVIILWDLYFYCCNHGGKNSHKLKPQIFESAGFTEETIFQEFPMVVSLKRHSGDWTSPCRHQELNLPQNWTV